MSIDDLNADGFDDAFITDRKLMKVKDGQSGYLSHSDFPLYFGLGSSKQIDRLQVTWPSGIEQVVEGPVAINRLLTIEEPEGESN